MQPRRANYSSPKPPWPTRGTTPASLPMPNRPLSGFTFSMVRGERSQEGGEALPSGNTWRKLEKEIRGGGVNKGNKQQEFLKSYKPFQNFRNLHLLLSFNLLEDPKSLLTQIQKAFKIILTRSSLANNIQLPSSFYLRFLSEQTFGIKKFFFRI